MSVFEQAFRNIDDVLRKEAGCSSELDYTEQASWLHFLKYLDDLEQDKNSEAALEGRKYTYILDAPYSWDSWAAPKEQLGKLDHNRASTGDDLRDFVNTKLFPYLHGFKLKATGPNTSPGTLRFGRRAGRVRPCKLRHIQQRSGLADLRRKNRQPHHADRRQVLLLD